MKLPLSVSLLLATLLAFLDPSRVVFAAPADGGTNRRPSIEAGLSSDGRAPVADGASSEGSIESGTSDEVPLRCGGALCDTTTGATTCSIRRLGASGAPPSTSGALALSAVGVGNLLRRTRRAKERAQ